MNKGRPKKISKHVNDLTGQIFDYLTVLRFHSITEKSTKYSIWHCQCKCGKKINRSIKYLKGKPRQSCGCHYTKNIKNNFESNFQKTKGCWEWKGNLNKNGYGNWAKKPASRQAYIYYLGEIPQGKQVCHTCDNRKCVNPDHLFLGSISDNMKDKVSKNRQAKGSKIGSSKLNENTVFLIRKMRIEGKKYQEIANHFLIKWDLVRKICKNVIWKHVELGEQSRNVQQVRKKIKSADCVNAKLNELQVKEIKELLKQGIKGRDIAKKFNVNFSTICDIKTERTWKHVMI